ncbi:MAG TPA: ATP-binding protein [Actinomycetota bacterium]|nr:ATP-binding protein [Actinomycetota bacterium]
MARVIDLELGAEERAPSRARAAVATLEGNLSPTAVQALQLLVTELVTNCVRHGDLAPDASIRLLVVPRSDRIRVEVTDPGRGFGDRPARPRPAGEAGWGLYLVDRVADRWGVREDDGTHVWFELDRRSA